MSLTLLAKLLGLLGTVILSIPAIRDGKDFLVFHPLGARADSPDLVRAIARLKEQYNADMVVFRRSDLRYFVGGLAVIALSYMVDIADIYY